MTDIVEQLRVWPAGYGEDTLSSTVVGNIMKAAADEIERLRAASEWRDISTRPEFDAEPVAITDQMVSSGLDGWFSVKPSAAESDAVLRRSMRAALTAALKVAHPAPAAPVPASVREVVAAFELLRKKMRGDTKGEELAAFARLSRAIASLPASEAAPTREEPTAEAIREILRAHVFATRHYEIRGLDEAANAILAIKSAPAK